MDQSVFTVIIRGGHRECNDKNITCCRDWTVEQLKKKIECVYPGNPEFHKQRLIFAGKLLVDDHKIENILKENNQIVHLAYHKSEGISSDNKAKKVIPPKKVQNDNNAGQPELRQRHVNTANPTPQVPQIGPHAHMNYMYSHAMQHGMPVSGNPEAYSLWMQQYQQQWMQYMQYYGYMTGQSMMPMISEQMTASTPAENAAQPVQPGLAENQPGQVNQELRMNAQGGAMIDDDDEGRDWLDAAFGLVRLCMMLSIIYFYSSTYRFVITVGVFIIIYLYQAGAFQVNRRPRPPPAHQNEEQQTDDNNNQSDGTVTDENSDDGDAPQQPPTTPPPPGVLLTAWHFVRSFFSSLLPTGPPDVGV